MNLLYTIAQQQPPIDKNMITGILLIILVVILIALVISFIIKIVICSLHYSCLARLPAEYRKMEPWQVWLLLIPIFSLAWNFFVYQRIPESYQAYFAANGLTNAGDCGKNLGLWYSICTIGSFVPFAGLVALVLMIIFIAKEFELRGKISPAAIK